MDAFLFAGPEQPMVQRRAERDVLREIRLPAVMRHLGGAACELSDIHADQRRRHKPGRR